MNNEYLQGIHNNLSTHETKWGVVYIKFGLTGNGSHPNYQITGENGQMQTYKGINHEPDRSSEFDKNRLTKKAYTHSEITIHWDEILNEILDEIDLKGSKSTTRGEDIGSDIEIPPRKNQIINRIIRSSAKSRHIKALCRNECQICGNTLKLKGKKTYAEAHHLQPLGKDHNGPDIIENMICVCPNHHAQLDLFAIEIDENLLKKTEHKIGTTYINYHNKQFSSN